MLAKYTPRIHSVLKNVLGEDMIVNCFLNWLGFILQERRKTTLAWLITTEARGTGKEVIFKLILGPIFGDKQTQLFQGSSIGEKFNSMDATCWLRCYDEVFQRGEFVENLKRREWLKTKIGSKTKELEPKGIDKIIMSSHINYMLFSNSTHALLLEQGDRRFNVTRNPFSIPLTRMDWWVDGPTMEKEIEAEIPAFAQYIQQIEVDFNQANYPTDTEARRELLEASKEDIQVFIDHLEAGDADFFNLDSIWNDDFTIGLVRRCIELKKSIPAKYANQLLTRMLKGSIINIRRRLEEHGVNSITIRIPGFQGPVKALKKV